MKMLHDKKNTLAQNDGFTLIELLVVIVIIGLLAGIGISSFGGSLARARDAKRIADLDEMLTAVKRIRLDTGAWAPEVGWCETSIGTWSPNPPCAGPHTAPTSTSWDATSALHRYVSGGYISTLPMDPINNGEYFYYYEPNNADAGGFMRAKLEATGTYYTVHW